MYININSAILADEEAVTTPVKNAIGILKRDMDKVFSESGVKGGTIKLVKNMSKSLQEEQYRIEIKDDELTISAIDELGFVYGILYISCEYLGIKPFWFWMDQTIERIEKVEINNTSIISDRPVVRFRGWFFNDEVLMLKWKLNESGSEGWKMAFEALLRCGGNMAIPGTDKMSRQNRQLAADMGLWITHHHAEPLGAEMFVRAYPDMSANYMEHPELFHKLWEEAVIEQKDCKVVWNVCFRGQGDMPFWSTDTTGRFDTEEKRGRMISDMIRRQCDIVRRYVDNPVFCTNLYGEIMELYEKGFIELDENVIKVRADNGYGKMVTRRRDNHSPRVPSMPDANDAGMQGIYYHVSFYDLQAANHITMLPNSVNFVNRELNEVLANKGGDFWVINCSNVRPHVYYLDAIRKKWFGQEVSDHSHSEEFAKAYFGNGISKERILHIAECYREYPGSMLLYGEHEDEHMGEQFYTENIRLIAHQLLTDHLSNIKGLYWLVGDVPLPEQIKLYCEKCGDNAPERLLQKCESIYSSLLEACSSNTARLFKSTILLHTKLHAKCIEGVQLFGEAYEYLEAKRYEQAFVMFGRSAECFADADKELREAEYDSWENFYLNDCFADLKHTAYMIEKLMGYVRELGDNPRHDKWYREYCYSKEDRNVFLLLVLDNHMTDWEIYKVMKEAVTF